MNLITTTPLIMAGIAVFVSLYHLLLYSRFHHRRVHLTFALTCVSVFFYDIACAGFYNAGSLADARPWNDAQMPILMGFAIFLLWFICDYTATPPRKLTFGLTLGLTIFGLLSLTNFLGLATNYSQPSIKTVIFPWGESVTYYEYVPGLLSPIRFIVIVLEYAYVVWMSAKFYQRTRSAESKFLLVALAFFFAGVINDTAVDNDLYIFIYLIEYSYLAVILFMTFALSRAMMNSAAMEEAVRRHLEETLKISDMKSNLIAFASHAFKTPLVPIVGWVDLMQKTRTNGESIDAIIDSDAIASLQRATQRLVRVIDNLLDVERLEYGKLELKKEIAHVAELLETAIKEVQDLAQTQQITIVNQSKDAQVDVDGFRIKQVFENILTNALKYSPPCTEILISSQQDDRTFHICFQDYGYGFTLDELRDVWEPFSTTYLRKQNYDSLGTGIGLFLSKGIVEQHGGTIEISSPGPNLGTAVTLSLPLAPFPSS